MSCESLRFPLAIYILLRACQVSTLQPRKARLGSSQLRFLIRTFCCLSWSIPLIGTTLKTRIACRTYKTYSSNSGARRFVLSLRGEFIAGIRVAAELPGASVARSATWKMWDKGVTESAWLGEDGGQGTLAALESAETGW